jgi:holo-[acyl-carrier protein] synthase
MMLSSIIFKTHQRFWRAGTRCQELGKYKSLTRLSRFAAKEACRKACDHLDKNTRGFQHIIILPVTSAGWKEHQSQRPEGLILHEALREVEKPEAAEEAPFDVTKLDGQICEISISHDGDYANAVALVPSMKHTDSLSSIAREEGD